MTKKVRGSVWLPLLVAALGVSVVGFAVGGLRHHANKSSVMRETRQNMSNVSKGNRKQYVRRGLLAPRLAVNLNALGNRLEKPGKERLTITGVMRRGADSQSRQIAATLEFPDKLRLILQNRSISFDGQETKAAQVPVTADELDLIESLAYDNAEHFFNAHMQGTAMRFLGSRFRTDDGSDPDYNGPYFDVYKIADQIKASGEERAAKLYYFNSETLLLERVTYVVNRNGSEVNIETKLSDWRVEDGEKVARRIERLENGKSVLVLKIQSVQFAGHADDGMFNQ